MDTVSTGGSPFVALSIAGFATANAQQPDSVTDVEVRGFVYEPQAVSPTDEQVAALKLPACFRISRFAEGLYNPRRLAVAADGTVYVTQRTLGNLVMMSGRRYLGRPTGIAVARDGALLIGDDSNNVIYRVAYGAQVAQPSPPRLASEILKPKSQSRLP